MNYLRLFYIILCAIVSSNSLAYDFEIENEDGVIIYYNYINEGKELEMTFKTQNTTGGLTVGSFSGYDYIKKIRIPSEVTYLGRTRKVTKIGKGALYGYMDLEEISIPPTISMIDFLAFGNNKKLTKVIIQDIVAWFNCDTQGSPFDYVYNQYMYSDENTKITHLIIPDGVTSIQGGHLCFSLEEVTIPNSVTSIGNAAFMSCYELNNISLQGQVEVIGNYAFSNCTNLTSISLPNSIKTIGEHAFCHCSKLSSISIPENVKTIKSTSFEDCGGLSTISIPKGISTIEKLAFKDCGKIEKVYSGIETPFDIEPTVFNKNTLYNATLYVPKGTIEKYRSKKGWKEFVWIEENESTNINSINDYKTKELGRFTLSGGRASITGRGIILVKMSDGTTKKIMIK